MNAHGVSDISTSFRTIFRNRRPCVYLYILSCYMRRNMVSVYCIYIYYTANGLNRATIDENNRSISSTDGLLYTPARVNTIIIILYILYLIAIFTLSRI